MRTRVLALAALLAAGCGGVPVQEPSTAKPAVQARAPQQNGAIFQDSVSFRPLFEDRRARFVGDTLTVVINESTTASKKAELSTARDASVNTSVTAFPGISATSLPRNNLAGSANTKPARKATHRRKEGRTRCAQRTSRWRRVFIVKVVCLRVRLQARVSAQILWAQAMA